MSEPGVEVVFPGLEYCGNSVIVGRRQEAFDGVKRLRIMAGAFDVGAPQTVPDDTRDFDPLGTPVDLSAAVQYPRLSGDAWFPVDAGELWAASNMPPGPLIVLSKRFEVAANPFEDVFGEDYLRLRGWVDPADPVFEFPLDRWAASAFSVASAGVSFTPCDLADTGADAQTIWLTTEFGELTIVTQFRARDVEIWSDPGHALVVEISGRHGDVEFSQTDPMKLVAQPTFYSTEGLSTSFGVLFDQPIGEVCGLWLDAVDLAGAGIPREDLGAYGEEFACDYAPVREFELLSVATERTDQ